MVGLGDTFDVLWIINDEVSIPHHREIHRQLADSQAFIQILQWEREKWQQNPSRTNTAIIYSLLYVLLNFVFGIEYWLQYADEKTQTERGRKIAWGSVGGGCISLVIELLQTCIISQRNREHFLIFYSLGSLLQAPPTLSLWVCVRAWTRETAIYRANAIQFITKTSKRYVSWGQNGIAKITPPHWSRNRKLEIPHAIGY